MAIYGYHTGRTYEFIDPHKFTQYVSITVWIKNSFNSFTEVKEIVLYSSIIRIQLYENLPEI